MRLICVISRRLHVLKAVERLIEIPLEVQILEDWVRFQRWLFTKGYANRIYPPRSGTLIGIRGLYQQLADRAGGELGELVAFLPTAWRFKTDPHDDGIIERWYLRDRNGDWNRIQTTGYWENQGHCDEAGRGYTGLAWYAVEFTPPQSVESQDLVLTFAGVLGAEIWVWLNGLLILHADKVPSHDLLDIDLNRQLHAGENNHIAVRILGQGVHQHAQGGIYRRVFLWARRFSESHVTK